MGSVVFNNSAKSSLSASVEIGDTTFPITDIGPFLEAGTTGDFYYAQMINPDGTFEIVKVDVGTSGVNGLTVARGYGGTAQAWPRGTVIWQCLDALSLGAMKQETAFRSVAYNPNGALNSLYFGEKVYQSDDRLWWKSVATGTQVWRLIAGVVQVADVVFDPVAGSYDNGQTLTMTCATSGASIYYTTDGSTPTETDNLYSVPITMPNDATTTYKAKAFGADRWETDSGVTTGEYIVSALSFAGDSLLLAGDGGWPRLPLVFDDGSGDKVFLVSAGSPSKLLSWDFAAGAWTVADSSWPAGADTSSARNPINVGGVMYVQGSAGILMSWNGSDLTKITNAVGATTYYAWSLGGKAHVANDYGAAENMERYDAGVIWTTILDAGVPVREGAVYNGVFYWVNASNMRLYAYNGVTNVEVAPAGITNNLWYECKEYGGVIYASGKCPKNTARDGISYWNGVDDWVTLFEVEEPPHNMDGNIGPFEYVAANETWYFYSGTNATELYSWKSGVGFTYLGASNSPDPLSRMFSYGSRVFALSEDSDLLELV